MKTKILLFLFILSPIFIYSQNTRVKYPFYLHDLSTGKDVVFNDIFDTYNINKDLPTLLIFWQERHKYSATNLVNRYAQSNKEKFNLVLVNMDNLIYGDKVSINGSLLTNISYEKSNVTESIVLKAKKKLSSATHFHLYSIMGGIDKYLDVTTYSPYLLYFDKNLKIQISQAASNFFPYSLFQHLGKDDALEYFKNSPKDVIDYMFSKIISDSLDETDFDNWKAILLENEKKVKNNLYKEEWLTYKGHKIWDDDLTKVKLYYCLSKIEFFKDMNSVSNAYLQIANIEFDKEFNNLVTNESNEYSKKRYQEKLEKFKTLLNQLAEKLK